MRSVCLFIVTGILLVSQAVANNVQIKNLKWDNRSVTNSLLKMEFDLSWDNSWRDDFNYDAVYVFFKFKLKDDEATPGKETWNHLYLYDSGNSLGREGAADPEYDFWLSPLSAKGQNFNTGIYVYRSHIGNGTNNVHVTVNWNITNQISKSLTEAQIVNNQVLIAAHAIEMVYVPRGSFRLGDNQSFQSFRKNWTPIPAEYDLVSNQYDISSSTSSGRKAADRVNENTNTNVSAWVGGKSDNEWWLIDFGENNQKKITFFGINASKYNKNNYPTKFRLQGADSPGGQMKDLWTGGGTYNWVMADDAYPVQRAIEVEVNNQKEYRCYRIYVDGMNSGVPIVNSIAMTDVDLNNLFNRTVVIDGPTTAKDTIRGLSAIDNSNWASGTIPETFPNGYKGFFAMKYEISQEQYVRFLNKLTYAQQDAILGGRLGNLLPGGFIFGEVSVPSFRNGIIVAEKPEGLPVVFANNLNSADGPSQLADGQNIACNYMCINDMLAYADWAGLRPLTEMEYEKMCRPPYPYTPQKGEYAWNSLTMTSAKNLDITAGTKKEKPEEGNVNFGNEPSIGGPLRVGAFANSMSSREKSGAGFSGVMELSGNLAEMYYNANNLGMTLFVPGDYYSGGIHYTAHGDGFVGASGQYDGYRNNAIQWKTGPQYITVRGGSWASDTFNLSTSDRSYATDYFSSITQRDSTVSFRLGRSVPEQPELTSVLTLENGTNTASGNASESVFRNVRVYHIQGNRPTHEVCTYLWYLSENGGLWKLLDGENEQNLVFKGFRKDTLTDQTYIFKRKVITPYTDSKTSSERTVTLTIKHHIIQNGTFRCWADGTYARSAAEYRNPASPYTYQGAVGSGIYRIDPDGDGPIQPFDVWCDMETDGGGWMLAGKFSNHDTKRWCVNKDFWTNTATFGDATDIETFADAKTAVWAYEKVNYMMFKTMKVTDKAFITTDAIGNKTLSDYFTAALEQFPNTSDNTSYAVLRIKFVNATYTNFPWIDPNDGNQGFRKNRITIGRSDTDDSQGVISGYYDQEGDADWGLGSLEDAVFNSEYRQSDVGPGGSDAREDYNVLLFVK